MKKLFLLLFISNSFFAFSQMPAFTIGTERPMPTLNNPEAHVFRLGTNNYVLFQKYSYADDMQLHLYGFSDPNDKLACMETIAVPHQPNEIAIFEGFIALSDKMILFRSVFSKAEKKAVLFAYAVSERGLVTNEGTEICSIVAEKALNQGNFTIKTSADRKSFVVLSEYPFVKETKEKFALTVFDGSLKQIWTKESELQYDSKRGPVNDVFLANSGIAYVVKRVEGPKNADFYSSYQFSEKGAKVKENLLEMTAPQKVINYSCLIDEATSDLIFAGHYTEDGKVTLSVGGTTFKGTFNTRISGTKGDVLSKNSIPFQKSQTSMQVIGLLKVKDNTFLLSETKYIDKVTTAEKDSRGFPIYNQEYSSNSIIISVLDANGKSLATTNIPYENKSVEDGGLFSSVGFTTTGDQLMLVYNDYQYKHDGQKHTVVGPLLASLKIPVVQLVAADGSLGKEFALIGSNIGGKGNNFALYPSICMPLTDKDFFFLCRGENKTIDPVRMKLP